MLVDGLLWNLYVIAHLYSEPLTNVIHCSSCMLPKLTISCLYSNINVSSPALYQPYKDAPTPAVDEWTLSENLRNDPTTSINAIEDHYKTFIVSMVFSAPVPHLAKRRRQTEQDFADIAGAGLNFVRLPIPFWAIEVRDGEPFLPKVAWT